MVIGDAVDPGNSAPHSPTQTFYPLGALTAADGITSIDNISIAFDIQHDDLAHVRIELLPNVPNPTAANAGQDAGYLLVRNRVNSSGNDRGFGMTGTELGFYKEAFEMNTIFQDSASRSILDASASSPYSGEFAPENGTAMNLMSSGVAVGLLPDEVAGVHVVGGDAVVGRLDERQPLYGCAATPASGRRTGRPRLAADIRHVGLRRIAGHQPVDEERGVRVDVGMVVVRIHRPAWPVGTADVGGQFERADGASRRLATGGVNSGPIL